MASNPNSPPSDVPDVPDAVARVRTYHQRTKHLPGQFALRPRDEPGPKFDLAPHKTQYVLVGTVELEPNSRFEWQFVDQKRSDVSVAGEYEIKLKAYGDGIQPENRFIPLSIEKDGTQVTFGTASVHTDPPPNPD